MTHLLKVTLILSLLWLLSFEACNKIDEFKQDPELTPLQQGFKASAAIGYCASLAAAAFEGKQLPENVVFSPGDPGEYSGSGIIYVNIDEDHPLPFSDQKGQILIGGIWNNINGGGVISIIFGDFNVLEGDFKFYGIHTIPIIRKADSQKIVAVFAEQDIVIGEGSDTIIHLGLSKIEFDSELQRVDSEQPSEVFAAVKQNVWFVSIDQQNSFPDVYDDNYTINGGGQILEANSSSGGILYHALIETQYTYGDCPINPLQGTAFIQNIKAGEGIDLGTILLDFHSSCDGQARVQFSTGKYISSNGKEVNLNFN